MGQATTSPQAQAHLANYAHQEQPTLPTFMDHIQELRGRLFWVAVVFLATSAAAYPFRDIIISILTQPLGTQDLVYITPSGGFSFIIKVCTYVGAVLTLPALIYHLYRYMQPLIGKVKIGVLIAYVLASSLLAAAGIAFAYFVSLPAALHFLTGFDLKNVTAMLTVDSYFSFVVTYLVGAAVLFQLPLVLLIINAVYPLTPGGLMKYQRYVILGAFVAAAIISPTPDATNQALLAVPIILMYQLGIILIMIRNSFRRSPKAVKAPTQPMRQAAKRRQKAEIIKPAKPLPRTSPLYFELPDDMLTSLVQAPAPKRVTAPARPAPVLPTAQIKLQSKPGSTVATKPVAMTPVATKPPTLSRPLPRRPPNQRYVSDIMRQRQAAIAANQPSSSFERPDISNRPALDMQGSRALAV